MLPVFRDESILCIFFSYCMLIDFVVPYSDLLWIAEKAVSAELPPNWSLQYSQDGAQYYYNDLTQESRWGHPTEDYIFELLQKEREIRGGRSPAPKYTQAETDYGTAQDIGLQIPRKKGSSTPKHKVSNCKK